jgi:hypothetical protein
MERCGSCRPIRVNPKTLGQFLAGDRHAERYLAQIRDLVAREDHLAVGFVVSAIDVMLRIRAGELCEAEELASACAQHGLAAGDADATGWYGAQIVAIRWYQGRLPELVPMLSDLVRSPTFSAVDDFSFGALALAMAAAGDERRATGELARLRWRSGRPATIEQLAGYDVLRRGGGRPARRRRYVGAGLRAAQPVRAASDDGRSRRRLFRVRASRVGRGFADRGQDGPGGRAFPDGSRPQRRAATLASRRPLPRTARSGAAAYPVVCRRRGRHWQIDLGNRGVQVEHSVGMLHLATPLANPDRRSSPST